MRFGERSFGAASADWERRRGGDSSAQAPAWGKPRRIHPGPKLQRKLGPGPTCGLGTSASRSAFWMGCALLADPQLSDHFAVAVRIVRLQVVEQAAALAHKHEQAAAGGMIFLMRLEVLGQLADPLAQNRDLDFRGTSIGIMGAEALNQVSFLSSRQHGVCYSSFFSSPLSSVPFRLP